MPDWISQTAIGAMVGSGLSVWWRRAIRWQVNLTSGFFIGWWGGDYVIAALSIPVTDDYQRAIGSGLGLIGFSIMDGIMRIPWGAMLRRVVDAAVAARVPK